MKTVILGRTVRKLIADAIGRAQTALANGECLHGRRLPLLVYPDGTVEVRIGKRVVPVVPEAAFEVGQIGQSDIFHGLTENEWHRLAQAVLERLAVLKLLSPEDQKHYERTTANFPAR